MWKRHSKLLKKHLQKTKRGHNLSFFSYDYIGDKMKKIIVLLILLIPINIKALETSATSAILMDQDSNRILYSKARIRKS